MKTRHLQLLLAAIAMTAANAQDGEPPANHRPPPPPWFAALDINQDGIISADEIAGSADTLIVFDHNHDGQITIDELRPPRPDGDGGPPPNAPQGPPPGTRPPPPVIAALDVDMDGIISADEIANASGSLATLDQDDNGELTPDEFGPQGPLPPRGNGQGRGPNGQRPGPPPQDPGVPAE